MDNFKTTDKVRIKVKGFEREGIIINKRISPFTPNKSIYFVKTITNDKKQIILAFYGEQLELINGQDDSNQNSKPCEASQPNIATYNCICSGGGGKDCSCKIHNKNIDKNDDKNKDNDNNNKDNENKNISRTIIKDFSYQGHRERFSVTKNGESEEEERSIFIKPKKTRVIHSGNRTIYILEDGTKGISKCCPTDAFDEIKGIQIAYTRAKIKSLQKQLKKLTKNKR